MNDLEARARLGRDGKPVEGDRHGRGRIVRVRSHGAGAPVVIRNPMGKFPGRIQGWTTADDVSFDASRSDARTVTVTPKLAEEGQEIILIVE